MIFERALDDLDRAEICARLCKELMDKVSRKVHHIRIKDTNQILINPSQLLQKWVLHIRQSAFRDQSSVSDDLISSEPLTTSTHDLGSDWVNRSSEELEMSRS